MWALIVDGSINRFFKVPTAFKHPTTGLQYPRNWINLATDSEKSAIGLIEVTYSGSHGDQDYYINSESAPVYDASAGTVVITKSSTAKDLATLKIEKTQLIEDYIMTHNIFDKNLLDTSMQCEQIIKNEALN